MRSFLFSLTAPAQRWRSFGVARGVVDLDDTVAGELRSAVDAEDPHVYESNAGKGWRWSVRGQHRLAKVAGSQQSIIRNGQARPIQSTRRIYSRKGQWLLLECSATSCDVPACLCTDDADGCRADGAAAECGWARTLRRQRTRGEFPACDGADPDQPHGDRDRSGARRHGQRVADQRHDGGEGCDAGAGLSAAGDAHGARIYGGDDARCGQPVGARVQGLALNAG